MCGAANQCSRQTQKMLRPSDGAAFSDERRTNLSPFFHSLVLCLILLLLRSAPICHITRLGRNSVGPDLETFSSRCGEAGRGREGTRGRGDEAARGSADGTFWALVGGFIKAIAVRRTVPPSVHFVYSVLSCRPDK